MSTPADAPHIPQFVMGDDECMVQVVKSTEDGMLMMAWGLRQDFTSTCEQMTELFGPNLAAMSADSQVVAENARTLGADPSVHIMMGDQP